MISFSNKCATYYVTAPVNRRRVCRASSNSSAGSAGRPRQAGSISHDSKD